MNYLTVEKLSKSYGEKLLFEDITFGIEKGQKIALVARNGSGKTTLLNIIAGIDYPDDGKVVTRNDISVSYLPQMDHAFAEDTVLDLILDTNTPVVQAVKNYERCLALAKNGTDSSKEMEHAMLEMDRLSGWDLESRVKEILSKFGIEDIFHQVSTLSGGQRKKVALARTLIANTDFLILDEPTNHLDIEMVEWLEAYLSSANTTLLMVTHDRYFLDKVCNTIVEIDNQTIYQYKGKYDYFLEKKAERIAVQSAEYEKVKELYQRELAWVHTSPQARTTKAKARIKSFDTLKENVQKKSVQKENGFHVKTERLGNKILEINNLNFAYPSKPILDDFSYIFKKGEKCGIVGKNGTGKSTLLKLLMSEIIPNAGKITPGVTVQFGYFSQDGRDFEGNRRVVDIVKEEAEVIQLDTGNWMGASQFLNYFGFKYEQQYTYYEDLSGGEKRKLQLLITLLKNPNFLILDEPTNDFDIETLNKLEDFLSNYQGCILVVSHDRWFMNKLVDHLFVFEGNGKVKDFYGNYTEYRIEQDKKIKQQRREEKAIRESVQEEKKVVKVSNKRSYKEEQEYVQLEIDIETLEVEKSELVEKMNSGNGDGEELMLWSSRYQEVEELLDEKSMRWLELSEKEAKG